MMFGDSDKFGVILILPDCAFTSEIDRTTIATAMQEIDERLTQQGAPEESSARSEIMFENALAISSMIAQRQIPNNIVAFTNIAYSFIYAFGKPIGFENVVPLRGVSGTFLRNRLLINPCLAESDYQTEVAYLGKKMTDHEENDDDEWDVCLSLPPTLH
jgi:hypothetical protein